MRLIDADKLVTRLNDLYEWCRDERRSGIEQAMCMVHEELTVDAVPVVRCKDCERSEQVNALPKHCECILNGDIHEETYYCADGKRKDGGAND